jgi:hypothetical protein
MDKRVLYRLRMLSHWRRKWRDIPDQMSAHLTRLNASRSLQRAQRMERVRLIVQSLPESFPATKSRALMAQALTTLGLEPTPDRLKRLRVYGVRYGLLSYDRASRIWHKTL